MPATVKTTEHFPADTSTERLDAECQMRIQAGAIRCSYVRDGDGWVMTTEWNLLGQND